MAPHLPRVTTFPILPEGHLIYKVSAALSMPSKEKYGSPLIGQVAPEVVLTDQLGRNCSLHATISLGRPIVLFFFPLAGSPHCTLESCHFRDALAESAVFGDLDAIVIGVSQDSPEILRKFADTHDLGFIVLSDHNREAMEKFGVSRAWLGLINNRATFIIDPNGIVRGMCEGVLDGRGHKTFAEKWLIRIEHELAGRTRTISNVMGPPSGNGRLPMATDGAALHRVVIGKDNSAAGAGIDRAPRYGAAPSFPPGSKSSASLALSQKDKKYGLRELFGKKSTAEPPAVPAKDASDPIQPLSPYQGSNDSLSRASSSKSGGRRSLRNVFARKAPPPLPPTYQHFDDNVQDFGQVEEVPTAQYDGVTYVTRYGGAGPQNGHWDGKSATSSGSGSRRGGAHSRSPSSASHGGNAAHGNGRNVRATDAVPVVSIRRGAGSGRESPLSTGTAMYPTSPNLGSYSHLHGSRNSEARGSKNREDGGSRGTSRQAPAPSSGDSNLVGLGIPEPVQHSAANTRSSSVPAAARPPRRSRDVPDDVPRDAIEDEDESEDFVTQLADGVIDLTPRPRYEQYQQGLPVRPSTATGQESHGSSVKPFGSQRTRPAGSRPRSSSRPSGETVRSSSVTGHLRHVASDENLYGEASGRLTPLAPRPRPSTRPQVAPSRAQRDSEAASALSRESFESLNGAQVQAAKRMVIHKDPVSPRRMSRSGSLSTTRTMPSPSIGQSPRLRATSTEQDRANAMTSPRKGRTATARPAPAPVPTYAPPPPPVGAHSPPDTGHGGGTSVSSPRTDLSSSSFPSSSGGSSGYASRSGSTASLTKPRDSRRPSGVSVSSVSSSGTFGNRAGRSTTEL